MDDGWSALAAQWSELWAASAAPAHEALIAASEIRPGSRVLDVGCGSGEFLRTLGDRGAVAAGVDTAPGMVALARSIAPLADIRVAEAERLPWPDGSFDVVTAVNALQFADDTVGALAEFTRVLAPGGYVAIANWAEPARNDLDAVESAVAGASGGGNDDDAVEDVPGGSSGGAIDGASGGEIDGAIGGSSGGGDSDDGPGGDSDDDSDGDLRVAGGLEAVLREAGLEIVLAGIVAVPWIVPNDETLVRGVLLGEDSSVQRELAHVVLAAARPFRVGAGYRLSNSYRYVVGRSGGNEPPVRDN